MTPNTTYRFLAVESQNRLREIAKSNSEHLFEIGDIAHRELEDFRNAIDRNHVGFHEYQFWNALGVLCGKSGRRVQKIMVVAMAFPAEIRRNYPLEFGYFEEIMNLEPEHWADAIEFIFEYMAGTIVSPARKPGVGEVCFLFRTHILGENINHNNPPVPAGSYSTTSGEAKFSFQTVFQQHRFMSNKLSEFKNDPEVGQFLGLLQQLDQLLPQMMRKVGLPVPKKVDISIEQEYNR